MVERLTAEVHRIEGVEGVLSDWSLPGEDASVASALDVARTICRRAERDAVRLTEAGAEVRAAGPRLSEPSVGSSLAVRPSPRASGGPRCVPPDRRTAQVTELVSRLVARPLWHGWRLHVGGCCRPRVVESGIPIDRVTRLAGQIQLGAGGEQCLDIAARRPPRARVKLVARTVACDTSTQVSQSSSTSV